MMANSTQGKFLRVLEERKYYRIGSFSPINLNLRILGSSKKSLNELDYFLKKELFKKLNFTKIYIPSLVERKDDFVDLIKAFIKQSSEKRNINKQILSDNFIQLLNKENFFDNYSQLEKFIDWVIVMFETKKKDIITHEIFE